MLLICNWVSTTAISETHFDAFRDFQVMDGEFLASFVYIASDGETRVYIYYKIVCFINLISSVVLSDWLNSSRQLRQSKNMFLYSTKGRDVVDCSSNMSAIV